MNRRSNVGPQNLEEPHAGAKAPKKPANRPLGPLDDEKCGLARKLSPLQALEQAVTKLTPSLGTL